MRRLFTTAILGLAAAFIVLTTSDRITAAPASQTPTAAAQPPDLRSRYGVGIGTDVDPRQVTQLGLEWYFAGSPTTTPSPAGTRAVYILPVNPPLPEAEVRALIAQVPGAAWLVGNEPNIVPEFNISAPHSATPEGYADALAFYASTIKANDPAALLIGPNVLNWNVTCVACPGFPSGQEWTEQMRAAYQSRYNAEPPLDVWSLHPYDLNWTHLPMGDAQLQIGQIQAMRDWLTTVPALADRPMWVTEIGLHWAYPGLEVRADGKYYPIGDFDYAHVEQWMRDVFGWLNQNAVSLNIERWFLWLTYTDQLEPWMSLWPTITLTDGPGADAAVTRLGLLYQELAGIR